MPGRRAAAWQGWPGGNEMASADVGRNGCRNWCFGERRHAAAAAAAIRLRETTRRPACRTIRDCGNSGLGW